MIHLFWHEGLPEKHYLDSWNKHEVKIWNQKEAEKLLPDWLLHTYHAMPYKIQKWNTLRVAILQQFDGIYFDFDMECLQPIAIKSDLIFGRLDRVLICNAVIGGFGNKDFWTYYLEKVNKLPQNKVKNCIEGARITGAYLLTELVKELNLEQFVQPSEVFFPKTNQIKETSLTFHHRSKQLTWLNK